MNLLHSLHYINHVCWCVWHQLLFFEPGFDILTCFFLSHACLLMQYLYITQQIQFFMNASDQTIQKFSGVSLNLWWMRPVYRNIYMLYLSGFINTNFLTLWRTDKLLNFSISIIDCVVYVRIKCPLYILNHIKLSKLLWY